MVINVRREAKSKRKHQFEMFGNVNPKVARRNERREITLIELRVHLESLMLQIKLISDVSLKPSQVVQAIHEKIDKEAEEMDPFTMQSEFGEGVPV